VRFDDYAQEAVDLVNADLSSLTRVRGQLAARPWLADHVRSRDVEPLRELQRQLAAVAGAAADGQSDSVVALINRLLDRHPIRPRISGHDDSSWHLHVSDSGASVFEVLAAECLFGLAFLVAEGGVDRIGRCSAPGCGRFFVDLTTNRARQYCSTRCATRINVARFRERQRHQ
jgi:predicted RNA-binding Zn ribbon-like protein